MDAECSHGLLACTGASNRSSASTVPPAPGEGWQNFMYDGRWSVKLAGGSVCSVSMAIGKDVADRNVDATEAAKWWTGSVVKVGMCQAGVIDAKTGKDSLDVAGIAIVPGCDVVLDGAEFCGDV
uniref:Uncharacterized protein n=1 Tax=Anopheles maculatus TaxID=74869 RepID=A0A182S5N7_9DIPT